MLLSFEQWRATRRYAANLLDHVETGHDEPISGFVYDGACYIEHSRSDAGFDLTISNMQWHDMDLSKLERILYDTHYRPEHEDASEPRLSIYDRLQEIINESEGHLGKAGPADIPFYIHKACQEYDLMPMWEITEGRDRERNATFEVAIWAGDTILTTETFYDREAALAWLNAFPRIEQG